MTLIFLEPCELPRPSVILRSPHSSDSATVKFLSTITPPLNLLSRVWFSTVILSLIMISSNTGRKFAVSPTIDNDGVSSDASSPVTADILVLPMNRSPLLLRPE